MHTADLYLDLMKRVVSNTIYQDSHVWFGDWSSELRSDVREVRDFDQELRGTGRDIPHTAHTMIGLKRLDNLRTCLEQVITDDVPGDVIETGVWRGGAGIYMRAILLAHEISDRVVWVADSFEGVPEADHERFPADRGMPLHLWNDLLGVDRKTVEENFRRYGLLDDQVRFLEGWFKDTLPDAPIERLSLLRVDGDLYESTMDALTHLYPKVSPGGFVIIDDYGALAPCRLAVRHFRKEHGITEPIEPIDGSGAFWRRQS